MTRSPTRLLIVGSGPGRADEAMQSRGDGVHPWWVRGWPVQPSAVQPTIVQSSALPVQSLTVGWTAVHWILVLCIESQCRVQLSEGEWVRRSSHQRRHYCLHALPHPFPLDFKWASILIFWLVWSVLIFLYATPGSYSLNWLLVKLYWGHCRHGQLSRVNRYEKHTSY